MEQPRHSVGPAVAQGRQPRATLTAGSRKDGEVKEERTSAEEALGRGIRLGSGQ